jgi:TBC1 domain family protein 5
VSQIWLVVVIPADYSGQLTFLLRYPSTSMADTLAPHNTTLLIRQALALQMAPNPATGASLMLENRTILDIPIEIPAPAPAPTNFKKGHLNRHQMASVPGREGSPVHSRLSSTPSIGLPEMIARGLIERGESLGINKTLTSALSELKVSRLSEMCDASEIKFQTISAQYPRLGLIFGEASQSD